MLVFGQFGNLRFQELANLGVQFPLHTAVDGLLKLLQKYAVDCRGPIADQYWRCCVEKKAGGYLESVFIRTRRRMATAEVIESYVILTAVWPIGFL